MLQVYNEESRIESCLNSFHWADEILIVDKSSTDKTLKIAKKFTNRIVTVPFSEGSKGAESNLSLFDIKSDWVFFVTASSLIHPEIVKEIIKLTTNKEFDYDVIGVPYAIYSFGIRSKRSPLSIPEHSGHRFRCKPATHSDFIRPLIPEHSGHP